MRVVCLYILNKYPLKSLAEACLRLTPQVALGQRCVFLEIGACRSLYSEASCIQRLQVLAKRLHVQWRLAIADDLPTALALAVSGVGTRQKIPIEALSFYANPFFETGLLAPAIEVFKQLGVRTLGDFMQVPRGDLASRFGKQGVLAAQHLDYAQNIPWPRFQPPVKIIESELIDEDYRLLSLEPLCFILKKLVDRALLRLRGHGQLASQVEVRVRQEAYSNVSHPVRTWNIQLALAQGSVMSLLPILRQHLERQIQLNPLQAPIRQVEFEICARVPGVGQQKDMLSKREEEEEAFHSIVSRLSDRLGLDKTFLAKPVENYFPEKSWEKTLDSFQKFSSPLPPRPLRLLKFPQPLQKIENYFLWKRQRWKVLEMQGPERLSGEWWLLPKEREYYRAVTESGEDLWVYTDLQSGAIFLHGFFD